MVYNFDIEVAKEYGVNEAIMISNFQFWIKKNKANNQNFYNGRYWTYNSKSALQKLFPFWTERQVRYVLDALIKKGVLITGNYNKSKIDKTNWYAFVDEEKWVGFEKEVVCPSDKIVQLSSDKIVQAIPDNKPDNKLDNKKNAKAFLYIGEFKNVKVTKEEFVKLVEKYGWYFEDGIEALSSYIAAKGDKYKDHYAVLKEKNWVWEKVHKDPECGLGVCEYIDDEISGETRLKKPLEYYAEMYKVEL